MTRNPYDGLSEAGKPIVWPTGATDIHVVPEFEQHDDSADCPCCPVINYQNPVTHKRVYVHNERAQAN